MKHKIAAIIVVLTAITLLVACASQQELAFRSIEGKKHSAIIPVPRTGQWWDGRHDAINERLKKGNVGLLFIGDSITQGWENAGKEIWAMYYAPRNAVNMGISGDRTQHVLWRLDHSNFENVSPELAVVLIGVNNSGDNTAEEIADGTIAICQRLRTKLPKMKILLLAILPTQSDSRNHKHATASLLASTIADGKMIHYLDINPHFLMDKQELTKEVMPDGLHPNKNGYRIWAEAIEPKVTQLIGDAIIYFAASRGDMAKVEALVRKGIDVNTADAHGRTALHYAAQEGHKDIAELLLSEGANINAKNEDGETPVDVALSKRRNDVVKLLIEQGADIPTIHLAAFVGSIDKLRSFIKTDTDINAKDERGMTPLLRAVTGRHIDAVELLIEAGADVNTGDEQGYVPLMYALWTMDSDMVKLLLNKGADVNAKDTPSDYTSLHWAVMMGSKELTELILEAGADINAESRTGETPMDLARQGGRDIAELLREQMLVHDVAVTNISAPTSCVQGDILPVTVSVANEGDQREAVRVAVLDTVSHVELAGREMILEPQKHKSANTADLILSPPSSGRSDFGWGINIHGDINRDGYADLLVGSCMWDNGRGRVCLYYGGKDMDTSHNVVLEGENSDNRFALPVLGDVNGDGYDDLIIGTPGYNNNDGRVYIFFGGVDMDKEADVIIDGEQGSAGFFSGNCLSAGDVDMDGFVDVLVGAYRYDNRRGRAFLYFGGDPMDSTVDFVFEGERAWDCFGRNATIGQDVDGDGFRDILIGARSAPDGKKNGRAYLFYGDSQSKMDAVCDVMFTPPISGWQEFGSSLDIFDVDNDRHADIVIGAREYKQSQGGFFLYWGDRRSEMDAVADVIFAGEEGAQSSLGGDKLFCADFDGDGYGDVAIGAYNWYQKNRIGRTYIYYGDAKSLIDTQPDVILTGDAKSGWFGHDIGGGDFNNDGYTDLVAGAWGYNSKEGRAYVFYAPFEDKTDLTFNWDTTNASIGKHTLKVELHPVEGEQNTDDNIKTINIDIKRPTM